MADLNALIAQGAQFRVPPPVDTMGNLPQLMQMRAAQNQNELAQYQLGAAKRTDEQQSALNALARDPNFNPNTPEGMRQAQQFGAPGYALVKSAREASLAGVTQNEAQVKLALEKQKHLGQMYRDISSRPSDANITAHAEDVEASPMYTPDEKKAVRAKTERLLAMPMADRMVELSRQGATAGELRSQVVAPGASLVAPGANTPYFTAPATPAAPGKSIGSVSPGDFTPASLAKFNVSGNFGDLVPKPVDRAPRPEAAVRTQQVTLEDGSLGIVNMDTGVITRSTVGGTPVKGKLSALAEKQAAAKVQLQKDLGFAITELSDAIKEGGLIDQSTGSGAGRLADISAGFVGKATPGAIAIGKLQPIADLPLKLVTRFEGPQSNADTKSYKEASAQLADPTLPRAIRKAAGATVVRLMKERQGQFVTNDMAPTVENAAKADPNAEAAAFLKSLGVKP